MPGTQTAKTEPAKEAWRHERAPYEGLDRLFIGGRWRAGRSQTRVEVRNPYNGERLVSFSAASAEDVDEAYRRAAEAQPAWARLLPQERRALLLRAAQILADREEEFIDWSVRETGGTRAKAGIEWALVREGMLEASTYPFRMEGRILPTSVPGKEGRVYRRPVGVVGVISPWDFPLQLANRSVAPALACGNAVVLKAPTLAPVTGGFFLARVYEEAGLPPGLLSVVVGEPRDFGDAFLTHPVPAVITFTGSTGVGRHVGSVCGERLKRAVLELGGNAPLIVLDDADLGLAVDIAVAGKFLYSGQICMAINRIIVDRRVHDEFVERYVDRVRGLKVGDPARAETQIGPVISRRHLEHLRKLLEGTKAAGARLLAGGEPRGLLMPPAVLSGVTDDMPAARKEIFGPVAAILRVEDEAEAVRTANGTEYALSAAVCSRRLERGVAVAKRLRAGMAHVNDIPVNDEANSPFGGEAASGYGRFGGVWAMREFTTEQWITVQERPRRYLF